MSIEALVKPPVTRIVGTWESNHALASNAALEYEIAAIAVQVEKGHTYKVGVSASVAADMSASNERTFSLRANAEVIVSSTVGMGRSGFAAEFNFPLRLIGIWMAPADASVSFRFVRVKPAASSVRELPPGYHNMWVEDLG